MPNIEGERILAGIRSTGEIHLGNYLGAMKPMVDLQSPLNENFYMIADLHAMTTEFTPSTLLENRRSAALDFLAVGLNPEVSTLFFQSDVPEHQILAGLLATSQKVNKLMQLPTLKEKAKDPRQATFALLGYPILMAADIILYKAGTVPVGRDQYPHIEYTREIVRQINTAFGTTFPEPKAYITNGASVPSLTGEGKMSKSIPNSYIPITADRDQIWRLMKKVKTDSGHGDMLPTEGGVPVLLELTELFMGAEQREVLEAQYLGAGIRYGDLKVGLTDAIFAVLEPIQAARRELEANPSYVRQVLGDGAQVARRVAGETVAEVKDKMGLSSPF